LTQADFYFVNNMNLVKFYVFKMYFWIDLPAVYAHHSITISLFHM